MSEVKIRLENEKRLYVVDLKGDTFKIVSGSLKGTVTSEEHRMLDGRQGRSAEQEALMKVGKLVEAKLKLGYEVKKGDVETLRKEVEALSIKRSVGKKQMKSYVKNMVLSIELNSRLNVINNELVTLKAFMKDNNIDVDALNNHVAKLLKEREVARERNSKKRAQEAKAKKAAKIVK